MAVVPQVRQPSRIHLLTFFHVLHTHETATAHVVPQVRQMFERFSAPSPADAAAARLAFFKSKLWPRLRESGASGLLIFVPSYFDFVRLRNFLRLVVLVNNVFNRLR